MQKYLESWSAKIHEIAISFNTFTLQKVSEAKVSNFDEHYKSGFCFEVVFWYWSCMVIWRVLVFLTQYLTNHLSEEKPPTRSFVVLTLFCNFYLSDFFWKSFLQQRIVKNSDNSFETIVLYFAFFDQFPA